MKTRLLTVILAFAMTLTAFPAAAYASVYASVSDESSMPGADTDADDEADIVLPPKQSAVKSAYIVANKKARINWTKSPDADGYILYRRSPGSTKWKKIAVYEDERQTYGYDTKVTKKTYYYTVKAYCGTRGGNICGEMDETGFKAAFQKNTVKSVTGDYKAKSVYGPSLSAAKLSEVKAAVQKFCDEYITSDMSDVEKVMVAQLYLAGTCTYAADWSKNGANTAWGALVYKNAEGDHEAQCSGYARAMKALCDGMGVDCRYVHANAKSANPSHQWVEVKIGKKWYIVDVQANATTRVLVFFLCGSDVYTGMTGMNWDRGSYPKVSAGDYSSEKINDAWEGYKVRLAFDKIF